MYNKILERSDRKIGFSFINIPFTKVEATSERVKRKLDYWKEEKRIGTHLLFNLPEIKERYVLLVNNRRVEDLAPLDITLKRSSNHNNHYYLYGDDIMSVVKIDILVLNNHTDDIYTDEEDIPEGKDYRLYMNSEGIFPHKVENVTSIIAIDGKMEIIERNVDGSPKSLIFTDRILMDEAYSWSQFGTLRKATSVEYQYKNTNMCSTNPVMGSKILIHYIEKTTMIADLIDEFALTYNRINGEHSDNYDNLERDYYVDGSDFRERNNDSELELLVDDKFKYTNSFRETDMGLYMDMNDIPIAKKYGMQSAYPILYYHIQNEEHRVPTFYINNLRMPKESFNVIQEGGRLYIFIPLSTLHPDIVHISLRNLIDDFYLNLDPSKKNNKFSVVFEEPNYYETCYGLGEKYFTNMIPMFKEFAEASHREIYIAGKFIKPENWYVYNINGLEFIIFKNFFPVETMDRTDVIFGLCKANADKLVIKSVPYKPVIDLNMVYNGGYYYCKLFANGELLDEDDVYWISSTKVAVRVSGATTIDVVRTNREMNLKDDKGYRDYLYICNVNQIMNMVRMSSRDIPEMIIADEKQHLNYRLMMEIILPEGYIDCDGVTGVEDVLQEKYGALLDENGRYHIDMNNRGEYPNYLNLSMTDLQYEAYEDYLYSIYTMAQDIPNWYVNTDRETNDNLILVNRNLPLQK